MAINDHKQPLDSILILAYMLFILTIALVVVYVLAPLTFPNQPEFSVLSASVSSFNITSFPPQLSADFNLTLSATNSNNYLAFHYSSVRIAMLYGPDEATIFQGSVPSFRHPGQSTIAVKAILGVAEEGYLLPDVAAGIANDLAVHKALVFKVSMSTQDSDKFSLWSDFEVQCKDVTVWFGDPDGGSMMGPPKRCEIYISGYVDFNK